jgi:hypothetical protein
MNHNPNKNETSLIGEGESARNGVQSVQVGLRLHAVDVSDRAIVANVSAVQPSAGMVFIDFGFLEQHAIDEIGKAARSGQASATIDGRLECRIAMALDNIAQLNRQLEQVLQASKKAASRAVAIEPMTIGADTVLQ